MRKRSKVTIIINIQLLAFGLADAHFLAWTWTGPPSLLRWCGQEQATPLRIVIGIVAVVRLRLTQPEHLFVRDREQTKPDGVLDLLSLPNRKQNVNHVFFY